MLSAMALLSQPALVRNPLTTNNTAAASNYVFQIAASVVSANTNTIIVNGTVNLDDFTIVQFEDIQNAVYSDQGKQYLTNAVVRGEEYRFVAARLKSLQQGRD